MKNEQNTIIQEKPAIIFIDEFSAGREIGMFKQIYERLNVLLTQYYQIGMPKLTDIDLPLIEAIFVEGGHPLQERIRANVQNELKGLPQTVINTTVDSAMSKPEIKRIILQAEGCQRGYLHNTEISFSHLSIIDGKISLSVESIQKIKDDLFTTYADTENRKAFIEKAQQASELLNEMYSMIHQSEYFRGGYSAADFFVNLDEVFVVENNRINFNKGFVKGSVR